MEQKRWPAEIPDASDLWLEERRQESEWHERRAWEDILHDDDDGHWLAGAPMDPAAANAEPLPTLPGFPWMHAGCGGVISGPTGGGRSSLIEACMYDAAKAGLRCAYLGSEVTQPEFNARANVLAQLRGDKPNSWALRRVLAQVRYLNLAPIIGQAWEDPATWVEGIAERYDLVAIDPLSVVGSTLDLDFDRSNREFVQFYDRLVAPLTARNVAVVLVENIGHASDARNRPKGASAKSDTADLTFVCRGKANPPGMEIECRKVRTVRAAFEYGHKWRFMKDTQAFGDVAAASESVVVITLAKLREVYDFIAGNPDCSKSAIYMGVQGRQETISEHIERLVHEGKVARKPKPGRGVVKAGHVYRVAQPWD